MSLYEHVFLARQDLSQAQVDALAETATKIVEENKGKVIKTETWGLRTLTYKIQKNRKAHFVMLDIDASGDTIAELERQTRMNEDVIRYMTVRVDKHEDGPSVMMRKSDRPERSERGGFGGDRDRGDRDRGAPRGDRGPFRPRTPRRAGGLIHGTSVFPSPQVLPVFRVKTHRSSIIKMYACFRVTFQSAARLSRRASPPFRQRSSVSWARLSSAPVTSACFRTS